MTNREDFRKEFVQGILEVIYKPFKALMEETFKIQDERIKKGLCRFCGSKHKEGEPHKYIKANNGKTKDK